LSLFEPLESRLCLSAESGLRADFYNSAGEVFSNSTIAVQTTPSQTETVPNVSFSASDLPAATEIRFSGQIIAPESGSFCFHVITADAVRLWVNNQEIIDNWTPSSSSVNNAGIPIALAANASYDIRLDISETGAAASSIKLRWILPDATRQIVPASQLYPFSQPYSITTGGLYVGSWESTDNTVTALCVATAQPVTIEDSTIRASGLLIANTVPNVQLSVINNTGEGLNPNIAGALKGDFLYVQSVANLLVENNTIIGVGGYGIHVYTFTGSGDQTIKILSNTIRNSDGRFSNGDGGYEDSGVMTHSIALQNIYGVPGMQIAWNQIINAPYVSYVNDVINLFEVSGTPSSPMEVDNNFIRGLYSLDVSGAYDSGSGITTDGSDDPAVASAFINIYDNQVINTGSAGIGVPAGHNIQVFGNTLLSTGYIAGGVPVFASGTGVYINDLANAGPTEFYDNAAYDNVSGWIDPPDTQQNGGPTAQQRDYEFDNTEGATLSDNADWPTPITSAAKAQQFALWQSMLEESGMTIGVVPDSQSTYSAPPAAVANPAPSVDAAAAVDSLDGITSLLLFPPNSDLLAA